ncbi:MAG: hypothetical protein DWQ05_13090 [Calditrichaeota bacterium]|nr:MAG: hypothetical protein DWQ05_13090 [Calditrichota bacterium]
MNEKKQLNKSERSLIKHEKQSYKPTILHWQLDCFLSGFHVPLLKFWFVKTRSFHHTKKLRVWCSPQQTHGVTSC